MSTMLVKSDNEITQQITEGLATIKTIGNVFYNPVQEFNRDLSLSVLNVFVQEYADYQKLKSKKNSKNSEDVQVIINNDANKRELGVHYDDGIVILEALSATGLRSIRYAKEIAGINKVVANDLSRKAVENITANIKLNNVEHLVETNCSDATMLMYTNRLVYDAIDLDPYGCPSIFLDSALQAVKDGGLLLVTATDMAVLAGNCPETCYVKYGAISLRTKSCHEMALRILLQCIESHANRYGRYIEPVLSISVDFYVRVFVRVFSGASKCKYTTSKLSMVYNCTGCGSFTLQPLGILNENKTNVKFSLPTGPAIGPNCVHCNQRHHMGGPIWSGPLHSKAFVDKVLCSASERLKTWNRIQGVLSVIREELDDVPLYYTLEKLSATLHCETPPMLKIRSAILNGGYRVSYTHANRTSIKTDAPASYIWDIMRSWEKIKPVKRERVSEQAPAWHILNKEITNVINFEPRLDANPESRRQGYVRFQENPTAHWGPGTRATVMVTENKISKSKKNQGKRKRNKSEESEPNKKVDHV